MPFIQKDGGCSTRRQPESWARDGIDGNVALAKKCHDPRKSWRRGGDTEKPRNEKIFRWDRIQEPFDLHHWVKSEHAMQTYTDFMQLALICARNAHTASSKDVAAVLWRMAVEHRDKAARLNGGKAPDLGEPPSSITAT